MRKFIQIFTVLAICVIVLFSVESITKFKVNPDKCIGCRQCIAVCPVDAISIQKGKAVIDMEKCNLCGECVKVCPVKAIKEYKVQSPKIEEEQDSSATDTDTSQISSSPQITLVIEPKPDTTKTVLQDSIAEEQARATESDTVEEETEPEKKTAIVDIKKCIGCGLCLRTCPNDAIELKRGKAIIDPEKCTGSGECIKRCPFDAIELK